MRPSIKFLGGVRTVTGSSHLVSTGKSQVLLDAGLFQGHRQEFYDVNTTFSYNPRKLDALVLSHAHLDHCGNIPTLLKIGMRAKIYATSETKDLCELMLRDSGKIQEEDVEYINKINKRLGLPFLRKPLYTQAEARKAIKRFHSLAYGREFRLAKDIFVTLNDAGHILGSSTIVLDIKSDSSGIRLGYAVDLGRKDLPIIEDPVVPEGLDYLVLESTYGGRVHPPIEEAKSKLREVVIRTVSRQGKIIIPSFTLERAQEVVYFLNELLKERAIPAIPMYVDSPLATDITDTFKYHSAYFNQEVRQASAGGRSPFESIHLTYIRDQQQSKALNHDHRPMIIIAGSGMCESGRILHHLKNNIEDSRNTILVVGYMAKNTLGRRIVEKERYVRIFGAEYELNAEVAVMNALSGHADKTELLDFVKRCLPLKRIFLVHGDEDQTQSLADALSSQGVNVHMPFKDEEVVL